MRFLDFAVVAIIGALMVGFVCAEVAEGGGGTYKINEDGSVALVESAKYGQPEWEPCNEHENCFSVTATANDTLPIAVNGKDGGYGTGKKAKIASDKIDPFANRVKYYAYAQNNVIKRWCYAWSNRNGAGGIAAYNYVRCWRW